MLNQNKAPIYEGLVKLRKKRIVPFDVPGHKRGRGNPELYAVAEQDGQLPEKEAQELRQILTDIFQEKMNKHKIK